MTSTYSSDNVYILEGPTIFKERQYSPFGLMQWIFINSPVFALLLQKCELDIWFDSDNFGNTCFIPCKEYSDQYFDYFQKFDREDSRKIILSATLKNYVQICDLYGKESIPTFLRSGDILVKEVHIVNDDPEIIVDELTIIRSNILFKNGMIHVVNGIRSRALLTEEF